MLRSFSLFWLLILLTGCTKSEQVTTFSQNVMTIDYHVKIGKTLTSDEMKTVQHVIDNTFNEINLTYNKWNPHSEISELNRLKAFEKRTLSPKLYDLFLRIDALVALSEGYFDPTIEPVQKLWIEKLEKGLALSENELETIRPAVGWNKIHFADRIFYKEDDRASIDLGGVAKGLCIDLLIERLNNMGYKDVYVEWGGDLRASGRHPDNRPWNVFISRLGDQNPDNAIAYVSLKDHALATSGDYFQYWTNQTGRYCHLINPKTLKPVEIKTGSVASASLLANDCVTADALAKVIIISESVKWLEQMKTDGIVLHYWLVIRD